jgi:hypothetical protein
VSGRYARAGAADTIAAALARKPRTPPPPRRVQAPKTRKTERERRGGLWLVVAALVLAVLGGGAAYLFLLRDDESREESVAEAMRAAGCTFRTFPGLAAGTHISDPEATPDEWNSFPPTSGPHFGQWVIWGDYEDPVRLAEAVHNLEHGGIVMYYGDDVPESEVAAVRRFYRDDPTAMLLSPLPRLGDKIALTAWYAPLQEGEDQLAGTSQGILAECPRFDENAFEAFREAYRFQGPERIPPESLQPGT